MIATPNTYTGIAKHIHFCYIIIKGDSIIRKTVTLICGWCGVSFERYNGEYNRQTRNGKTIFYCSRECTAHYSNSLRPDRVVEIEKICPQCNKKFKSTTAKKAGYFCSRSCASSGSMTEHRLLRASQAGKCTTNLITATQVLKMREAWKYAAIKKYLDNVKEPYEFEMEMPMEKAFCVFDLALTSRKIIVEFDAREHLLKRQIEIDLKKIKTAEELGWKVVHIEVPAGIIIDPIHVINIINSNY